MVLGSSVRQNLRIYKSGAFVKILRLEAFSVRQNFCNTKEIRFVKEILGLKVYLYKFNMLLRGANKKIIRRSETELRQYKRSL